MGEVATRLTTKTAAIGLFRPIGMLDPRLANLLEAIRVARSPTHSVEILGHRRVVRARHGEKIHHDGAGVTGRYSDRETALSPRGAVLVQTIHVASDGVRSGVETFGRALRGTRGGISRTVAQEQKQREQQPTQQFSGHIKSSMQRRQKV
jgi:hypothetical protein